MRMNETGPRGCGADAICTRAPRPKRGKVIPNPAPLLHRDCALLERVEDPIHGVGDRPHNEAVEEGNVVCRTRTRLNASATHEPEIFQNIVKAPLPVSGMALLLSEGTGDATPDIGNSGVMQYRIVAVLVFCFPNVPGNGGSEIAIVHRSLLEGWRLSPDPIHPSAWPVRIQNS